MILRGICFGIVVGTIATTPLVFMACDSGSYPSPPNEGDATTVGPTPSAGADASAADAGRPITMMYDAASLEAASLEAASLEAASLEAASLDARAPCSAHAASGLDDAEVAAGFGAVRDVYHCFSCHQNPSQKVTDAGLGIVLSGNNAGLGDSGTIFPPNLTADPTTGLGCWTDQEVENAILDGDDNEGGKLCPPMPLYSHTLTTADGGVRPGTPMSTETAQAIVAFLRSLPPVVNEVHDTTCVMDGGSGDD